MKGTSLACPTRIIINLLTLILLLSVSRSLAPDGLRYMLQWGALLPLRTGMWWLWWAECLTPLTSIPVHIVCRRISWSRDVYLAARCLDMRQELQRCSRHLATCGLLRGSVAA